MNFQSCRYNQDTKIGKHGTGCLSSPEKKLSLGSLITWNITKVLEASPYIDLKSALESTQDEMERESRDGAPMLCLVPEEQHLAAALLAWHRLGHQHADSLHEFIESSLNEYKVVESVSSVKVMNRSISKIRSCFTSSSSFDVNSITGPVIRLPFETKVVMRVENNYFEKKISKTKQKSKEDRVDSEEKRNRIKAKVRNEIKDACTGFGIDKEYLPKLAELEEIISDLRTRAANLSRRKTERLELLERTDMAWKDLEHGYERRLKLAEDKAKDTEDQIKRILEERNECKGKCNMLVEDLKQRSLEAEKMREKLTQVDKEVCGLACERLRLSELVTRDDAALAAEHCRMTQIDRELEFKEQAERRNIQYLESEISTARGLSIEAERATRSDMAAVQENLKQLKNEIKNEENKNKPLKAEISNFQKEKASLACDLHNFKIKCDDDMLRKIDSLKSKKGQLAGLKEKIMDCKCMLPVDASIEVKRTPSLAANCSCETDGNPKSCSCTSIRYQLMSDLLGTLFKGLVSDLSATGSLMPCQLLKCLDENHDWERDSILRTNIHSYCSQLFISELNIAITMSIENGRRKWLRSISANKETAVVTEHGSDARARSLAAELAEQILKRKAEKFTNKVLQNMSSRVQPCQCKKEGKRVDTVFPLFVKPQTTRKINDSSNLKRTINDVAQLRKQVEILKKETIGKQDLKVMEDKLTKIIQRASRSKSKSKNKNETVKGHVLQTYDNFDDKPEKDENVNHTIKDDTIVLGEFDDDEERNKFFSKPKKMGKPKTTKNIKNAELPSAVGVYVCDTHQISKDVTNACKASHKGLESDILNVDVEKFICCCKTTVIGNKNHKEQSTCPKECICIHKISSNTSMNEFLDNLTKTGSYYKKLQILTDTKNSSRSHGKSFLNKPTISEYMCAINLNMANENYCNVKFLNTDASGSHQSNLVDTSCRRQTIISKEKLNSDEENNNEVKKSVNKHYEDNEYGTPVKDNSLFQKSKDANISAVVSTPLNCVCCNDENSNADEIEINALNLLKEHIKDKIEDVKLSLKHSISIDEEKNIFEDILKGIKNIVTDDTFKVLCKCSFKDHEGSRQRAYNLLKEYLKIKIKKVQCSCINHNDHSSKLLPTILDKITEVIENDFERLKAKYEEECINKGSTGGLIRADSKSEKMKIKKSQPVVMTKLVQNESAYGLKKNQNNIEMSNEVSNNFLNHSFDSEMLYGVPKTLNIDRKLSCLLDHGIYLNTSEINEYAETFYTPNKPEKKDNKSAQVSFYFNSQNKSSDAIQVSGNNIDENVSCTLGNDVFITDCKCRKNLESNYEKTTRSDTKVLYFDINDHVFGANR